MNCDQRTEQLGFFTSTPNLITVWILHHYKQVLYITISLCVHCENYN